jgi:hypothetical protein
MRSPNVKASQESKLGKKLDLPPPNNLLPKNLDVLLADPEYS